MGEGNRVTVKAFGKVMPAYECSPHHAVVSLPLVKPTVLTVEEAATCRGVSRTMIYAAIARRKLPRRYQRGHLVVREADLLAWEAGMSRGGYPKGKKQSAEAKARIAQAQKQRWARRQQSEAR